MNEGNGQGFTTDEYRKRIFIGSDTTEDPERVPPSLDRALAQAYEDAKRAGKTPPFRVKQIWLDGTNPITDYIVEIEASG